MEVPLTAVGSNPARDFWIHSCEEAILLSLAVLLRSLLVPEIMHDEACEVFLHKRKLETFCMTSVSAT